MSSAPTTIRWQIEMLSQRVSGQACGDCGQPIDGALLLQHLEAALQQANAQGLVIKRAALQLELETLCHQCLPHRVRPQSVDNSAPLQNLAQRRRGELEAYFQDSSARIEDNPRVRDPQRAAYLAQRAYFARESSLPAIVEIPTGCGKTGIICTAPFGVSRGRVLIITPNLTIKRSVIKSLAPLDSYGNPNADNFYLKCGVFQNVAQTPRFVVLQRGQVNREDCLRADIIVSNVQQIQSWLPHLERDFFDMIIVDEAHHEPADSWQRVSEAFPAAKKLYLTATPHRADHKILSGETVYRYPLASAISNDYVKNVMKVDAVATKMTFTIEDETREYGADEILSMREEGWFSKGVALSPLCNATIVNQSIGIWKEKKKSGLGHQIIGAACSIRHALQIVDLYQERGVKTTHVASEGMTMEDRLQRIGDYERGVYECIVHVGILGEGYDNPNISVAAIFRPYRSLAPYAQFVGRAIRWIHQGNREDNLAHVVSHIGLNLNFLWQFFKHDTSDAAFLSHLEQLGFNEQGDGYPTEADLMEMEELEPQLGPECTQEEIAGYDIDTFLPCEGMDFGYIGPIASHLDIARATLNGPSFRNYGAGLVQREKHGRVQRARETVRQKGGNPDARMPLMNRIKEQTPELPFNRPEIERKQYRGWLNKEVQSAAGFALFQLQHFRANVLEILEGETPESKDVYAAMVRAIHRAVNRLMDKEPSNSQRNDWTVDELQTARQMVGKARAQVCSEVRQQVQDRDQLKLEF